jgi:repressor LexA
MKGIYYSAEEEHNKNSFGTMLAQARKNARMSQKDLADELSSRGTYVHPRSVSKWENGQNVPNAYQLMALCHILGINDVVSYFTGKEVLATPSLNRHGTQKLEEYKELLIASGLYIATESNLIKEPEPEVYMRIFDEAVAAGAGNIVTDGQYEEIAFPVSTVPKKADFGLRVNGKSMMPNYVDGQIVWVEQCSEIYPGEIGVFIIDDKSYLKKYSEEIPEEDKLEEYTDSEGCVHPKITLISLNPEYDNIPVSYYTHFMIVGRVLN